MGGPLMASKECNSCHEEKALEDFHKRSISPDGLAATCRPCANRKTTEWRKENPEKRASQRAIAKRRYHEEGRGKQTRDQRLQYRYGITEKDFEAMEEAVGGKCEICRQECSARELLSVDHDHQTGEVRGLLCHHCNTGLGHFQDCPDLLQEAIRYLGKNSGESSQGLDRSGRR